MCKGLAAWIAPVKSQRKQLKTMSNINHAVRFLEKEIDRLKKEVTTQELKESIAKQNKENALKRIEELQNQIDVLDPKTAFTSL